MNTQLGISTINCSQARLPINPILYSIEDAQAAIVEIFKKSVICRHDVCDLQTILNSQRGDSLIFKVKEKIIEISVITSDSKKLISLFYLQGLLKDLNFNDLKLTPESIDERIAKDVAYDLPYCASNRDIKRLFGNTINYETKEIIKLKNEEFVKAAKKELLILRQINSKKFPSYLDEIAARNNDSNLFMHLIRMKVIENRSLQRDEIKRMTFLELSNIILEVREMILEHVEKSIPQSAKNIIFLLGPTGAGKSTTQCFLRGDKMMFNNFSYTSLNDKIGQISNDMENSCTFLPIIKTIIDKNLTLVDFPGFDDSNGPLVALGIELAIKALINKYTPQILVIESITNKDNKFANAGKLGELLDRILECKDNCILGITKYSQDLLYQTIKDIKIKLHEPTLEEIKLLGRIEGITEDIQEEIDHEKKEMLIERKSKLEQNLKEMQRLRSVSTLENSQEAQTSKKTLEDIEAGLIKQVGLKKIIRFTDLEDHELLISSLDILSNSRPAYPSHATKVNPLRKLKPDDIELLNSVFKSDLLKDLESHHPNHNDKIENLNHFNKKASSLSIVHTIADPKIGEFLHLPEMDPKIVENYDHEIFENCIAKYIQTAVGCFEISFLEKLLNEKEKKQTLTEKQIKIKIELYNYKEFIIGLLGKLPNTDERLNQAQWEAIERQYEIGKKSLEKKFEVPRWTKFFLIAPLAIPYVIHRLWKVKKIEDEKKKVMNQILEQHIDEYSKALNETKLILTSLIELKETIKERKKTSI